MSLIRSMGLSVLCLFALPSGAADGVRVPAADVVEAARAAVLAKASEAGLQVKVELAGRVQDLQLPGSSGDAPIALVEGWQGPWLRPRVGVPVQVRIGEKKTSTTVWLSVSASMPGEVYTEGFARGEPTETLRHRTGQVDLARSRGERTVDVASLPGMRLRHAVRVGDPVLASDLEPVPTISARQTVDVRVTRGVVSLSVPARALTDGEVGQTISVLPSNTTRPIRARVLSARVVTLED